jgi:hypothetical protein
MKRAMAVGAAVAILAVAGCSKSDSSADDVSKASATTAQPTTTTTAVYTTAELKPMLLTVADLPPGWSVDNSSNDSSSSAPKCFQDLEKVGTNDPAREAEIAFVQGSEGIPALMESLGAMTPAEFDEGVGILNGCTDISFEADGQQIPGTIGALSIEKVGDQSAAWRMSFDVEGTPLTFEFSVTRVGSVGVLVGLADLGGVEEGLLDTMTAKAVGKISSAA